LDENFRIENVICCIDYLGAIGERASLLGTVMPITDAWLGYQAGAGIIVV